MTVESDILGSQGVAIRLLEGEVGQARLELVLEPVDHDHALHDQAVPLV